MEPEGEKYQTSSPSLRVAKSQNHHRTRFSPVQNVGADVHLRCSALSEDALERKKRGEKRVQELGEKPFLKYL